MGYRGVDAVIAEEPAGCHLEGPECDVGAGDKCDAVWHVSRGDQEDDKVECCGGDYQGE